MTMDDNHLSLLRELERFGAENDAKAARSEKMLNITPDTGQLLAILVQATKARRVLEIGTSNGYSTIWLASAAKTISGQVVTVEVSSEKTRLARHNLDRAGLVPWVRQEATEAGAYLRQLAPLTVDLLFLDADREQYLAWWPCIQRVLVPGGLLVVDNAVSHASELKAFTDRVCATPGWQCLVMPIGNGEFVAMKALQ
jgi:predicted O-methyltransferase YrrM